MRPTGDPGDFAIGPCRECRRDVLTYPDGESETRRCIHCDERLNGALRWIDAAELESAGYVLDSGEDPSGGCASCVNAGCGSKSRSDLTPAR